MTVNNNNTTANNNNNNNPSNGNEDTPQSNTTADKPDNSDNYDDNAGNKNFSESQINLNSITNSQPWQLGSTKLCAAAASAMPKPTTSSTPANTDTTNNNNNKNDNSNINNTKFEIGMKVRETPSPLSTPSVTPVPSNIVDNVNLPLLDQTQTTTTTTTNTQPSPSLQQQSSSASTTKNINNKINNNNSNDNPIFDLPPSQYEDKLSNLGISHPSEPLESILATACDAVGFDIVEMWLRTGHKTHQLVHSHLRYSALDDTTRSALVNVYYGGNAQNRTHKLSPALCRKARDNHDIFWVTSGTYFGAQALKLSLNDVKTAVAVPVCHEESQTNMTVIYFSMKKKNKLPATNEFLAHMSLAAAIVSVNVFDQSFINKMNIHHHGTMENNDEDGVSYDPEGLDRSGVSGTSISQTSYMHRQQQSMDSRALLSQNLQTPTPASTPPLDADLDTSRGALSTKTAPVNSRRGYMTPDTPDAVISSVPQIHDSYTTNYHHGREVTWDDLKNIEYLTDGGNNWIHTAVMENNPVVIKQLKPEVTENINAMDEIENERNIHMQLDHRNIVRMYGSGYDRKGNRFIVMERLDGGTLSQLLGYNTRIRDNRRRFFSKKNKLPYVDVLKYAQQIAASLDYLHRNAIEGSMILHRDLKPDNVGFTLDGTIKLMDFGLSTVVHDASAESNDVYELSGETGSLRYMAPEVATRSSYNNKADVYSFGILLWELVEFKKPFDQMNRDEFFEKVIHGGLRPIISKKVPSDMATLLRSCWDLEPQNRPTCQQIVIMLAEMLGNEKTPKMKTPRKESKNVVNDFLKKKLPIRRTTWF